MLQIRTRRLGSDHQRQCGCIRCDDEVLAETALESQSRDAKRAVLVVEVNINGVVAALRNAPRHATLATVRDLPVDRRLARLVEECVFESRHDQ
jgi:hypothetical protein